MEFLALCFPFEAPLFLAPTVFREVSALSTVSTFNRILALVVVLAPVQNQSAKSRASSCKPVVFFHVFVAKIKKRSEEAEQNNLETMKRRHFFNADFAEVWEILFSLKDEISRTEELQFTPVLQTSEEVLLLARRTLSRRVRTHPFHCDVGPRRSGSMLAPLASRPPRNPRTRWQFTSMLSESQYGYGSSIATRKSLTVGWGGRGQKIGTRSCLVRKSSWWQWQLRAQGCVTRSACQRIRSKVRHAKGRESLKQQQWRSF